MINLKENSKNILYYSMVDWKWIKQRPHFVCIYLNTNGFVADFAYPVIIARSFFLKHYYVKNDDCNNILKVKIKQLPKESVCSFIRHLNKSYRYWQLDRLIERRQYQAIIITHPFLYSEAIIKAHCPIIFEMMDDYLSFGNMDKTEYLKKEEQVCQAAKKIVVSSAALKRLLIDRYPAIDGKIHIINNAFDLNTFRDARQKVVVRSRSSGKKLVYVGTIGRWIDFGNLIEYANENPRDTIQLVGPLENLDPGLVSKIKSVSNIIMTGPVEHREIRSFISDGDIMLVPFIPNPLIQCVDPVKVYEYIFFRKPVVCTYWPELDKFGDFVEFYDPSRKNGFSSAVLNACVEKVSKERYSSFIKENSWEIRAREYSNIVEQVILGYPNKHQEND